MNLKRPHPEPILPPSAALAGRLRVLHDAPVRSDGRHVLYWMVAARRPHDNHALQRAAEWARALGRPLWVLEALRVDYPWASDRLHGFVLNGMADNARYFAGKCGYYPYVERTPGAGRGLLEALAADAALVVTDHTPVFFLPRMQAAAAARLAVRCESVDSVGLTPLGAFDRDFSRAAGFRSAWQKRLLAGAEPGAAREPLRGLRDADARLPGRLAARHRPATLDELDAPATLCRALPIDHGVATTPRRGGYRAAERASRGFAAERLARYGERGDPLAPAQSGLSPYLHFGHIAPQRVFADVADAQGWSPDALTLARAGRRTGFWGMAEAAEGFLDELITWRELSYHMAERVPHHTRYEVVPDWAQASLAAHLDDPREHIYTATELEEAGTGDELWNAMQRQLQREGTIHGYLRMLWGKRVLQWTRTPEQAHALLVRLNDRYALDGRDPCSYSGIGWCFGLFDRAWGPERPVFGKVRYMNVEGAHRKFRLADYLDRYA